MCFLVFWGTSFRSGRHKIFSRLPEIKVPALVVTGRIFWSFFWGFRGGFFNSRWFAVQNNHCYTNFCPRFPNKNEKTGTPDFITPARCSYDMAIQLGGPCNLVEAWKQPLMDGSWRVFFHILWRPLRMVFFCSICFLMLPWDDLIGQLDQTFEWKVILSIFSFTQDDFGGSHYYIYEASLVIHVSCTQFLTSSCFRRWCSCLY